MEEYVKKDIESLIGDFYQAHANNDTKERQAALDKIQNLLFTGEADSEPFREYFNDIYSGRSAYNTLLSINDYPKESIIRELLQNTFGCYYQNKDIKVVFNFTDSGEIHLSYNEVGFSMEQFLYYLSIGRNDGDTSREGRFGVGAKSVFMNVEWFYMRSNNFSFRIENRNGTLYIKSLNLLDTLFKGTELVFKPYDADFVKIKENLLTLTEKKGDYINLVELCFAFNRKKVLNLLTSQEEAPDRTFNIAVMEDGKPLTVYKIINHQKTPEETPKIRFMQNNKSVVDFIVYENEGFVYLVPFAVANAKREGLVKILLDKYNYFSTYELTGHLRNAGEAFVEDKLTAFFISVPNTYITFHRTGIRHDSEEQVMEKLENDLLSMLEFYSQYFVLELHQLPESENYYMFPKSYAFEFFKNFIQSSRMAVNIRNKFQESISLLIPGHEEPTPYSEMQQIAFASNINGVSEEAHTSGAAKAEFIEDELTKMRASAADMKDKIMYAGYSWESEDGSKSGREFVYDFNYDGNSYIVNSDTKASANDYNMYVHFGTLMGLLLKQNLNEKDEVDDEEALERVMSLFDDIYHENYRINMKYFQFYVTHEDEKQFFGISKIQVKNLKNAIDTVSKRQNRFETHQNYNDVITTLVNSFTQGKDTMDFLREIKAQGGEITLQLDINKKYRFFVYGKQFMIPSKITNADMLEIIGDVHVLLKCGMLNGRTFDFSYQKCRYAYDRNTISRLLSENGADEKALDILSKIYICNLKIDKIAILDVDNKFVKMVSLNEELTEEDRAIADKYVVLRDDYTKTEFSSFVEYLLTDTDNGILAKFYSSTEEPNQLLPDQIPYYLKPLPSITRAEFKYLKELYRGIGKIEDPKILKNYFTKDINSKMFGYGGVCSVCGYESDVVNSFVIKDFEVGLLKGEYEESFHFSLYLCANDAFSTSGWIIEDVSIGGMSPFLWLEEVEDSEIIPSEFLFCQFKYRPQVTFDVVGNDVNGQSRNNMHVFDGAQQVRNFVLTPLMAAKWVCDNTKDVKKDKKTTDE